MSRSCAASDSRRVARIRSSSQSRLPLLTHTLRNGSKSTLDRRACGPIGLAPKTFRYAPRRSDDLELRARLKKLESEQWRFSYRRLHVLLRREGIALNHKKLFRPYREERQTVRRRGGRKQALGTRSRMGVPQGKNQRWSLDFVSDTLDSGSRFRILN